MADKLAAVARTRAGVKLDWPGVLATTRVYTDRHLADLMVSNGLVATFVAMHGLGALSVPFLAARAAGPPGPPRPVRSIRVIDPFCGPGHLLTAALDGLVALHHEERRLAEIGCVPSDWVVPPSEVVATIIEEQLVGIDIDNDAIKMASAVLRADANAHGERRRLRLNLVALAPGIGTFDRDGCDALHRRYDLVVMNPPYGGQRQLDPGLWGEVTTRDPLARSDLAVAAISRGWELVDDGGCLAVLAPATWLASTPARPLRHHLSTTGHPRLIVSLGQRTFRDAPLVFAAICVIDRTVASPGCPITEVSVDSGAGEEGLRIALAAGGRSCPKSVALAPASLPFRVRAPEGLLSTIGRGPTVGERFETSDGRWVTSLSGVRYFWELPPSERGWQRLAGGQGYQRWYGATRLRIRDDLAGGAAPAGRGTVEYGRVAGGRLSARRSAFGSSARAGVVRLRPRAGTDGADRWEEVLAIANSRVGTAWLQTLSAGLNFNPGYLATIPLGVAPPPDDLRRSVRALVGLRRRFAQWDLTADEFHGVPDPRAGHVVAELAGRVAALEAEVEDAITVHLGIDAHARADLTQLVALPTTASVSGSAIALDFVQEVVLRSLGMVWPRTRREPHPVVGELATHGVAVLRDGLGEPSLGESLERCVRSSFGPGDADHLSALLGSGGVAGWTGRAAELHHGRFRATPVAWCVLGADRKPLALVNAHLLAGRPARERLAGLVRRCDGDAGLLRMGLLDRWGPDWSEGLVAAALPLVASGLLSPRTARAR